MQNSKEDKLLNLLKRMQLKIQIRPHTFWEQEEDDSILAKNTHSEQWTCLMMFLFLHHKVRTKTHKTKFNFIFYMQ